MRSLKQMYLGIDCGTQATKALLIDRSGQPLGRGHATHAIVEGPGGRREQEPCWWIESAVSAIRDALAQAGSSAVAGIGVSGQQHGLVILDEAQQVIRPAKLWNDTETAPQNDQLLRAFGGPMAWLERFGVVPFTGYTVSKLLWLKQSEPHHFARIRHILLPHEYLNFYLTGVLAAEWGDASGTGFFNPRTRAWIPQVLDFIDGGTGQLRAALPALLRPDQAVGPVSPQVAAQLGIEPGAVVAPGGGDNMMGAIGTGNLRQGVVTVSLGTSSTIYSFRDAPPAMADPGIAPFCSSSGGWLPLVCTMNCTNIVSGTLTLLGSSVDAIDRALETTEPGADGLTFLPFLNGERTPDLPTATGSLLGVTALNYTPAHLLRATIEGVTFGVLAGMERIFGSNGPDRILAIGGGARGRGWRQLLADVTDSIIDIPAEEESACLGAAVQAMCLVDRLAGGTMTLAEAADRCVQHDLTRRSTPIADHVPKYRSAFTLYQQRLRTLYDVV